MNRRSLLFLLAAVIMTFGITRYTTINGVLKDSERIIDQYQRTIALADAQHIEADQAQLFMSRMKQSIYFSRGIFQWRMGLIFSSIISLTIFGFAFLKTNIRLIKRAKKHGER